MTLSDVNNATPKKEEQPVSRILAVGMMVAVVATSLLLAGTASAAPKTVVGTVGPGFTISLKIDGKKVSKLKAGVAYRFVIKDQSSSHDFHITGPGVSKVLTGVGYTGTKSTVIKLKKGSYTYVCDPHSIEMRGSFRVS